MDRVITNPVTGERATFLMECAETNGEYTKVMVELAPHAKGVPTHYHTRLTEEFEVVEGEMFVRAGREKKILKSGEKVFVPAGMLHTFRNKTDQPTKFIVEIRPGSVGFERSMRCGFGLARDGKTKKSGMPKSMVHLALLAKWGEGMAPWPTSIIIKMLTKKAEKAEKNGIAQELIERYCS